MAFRIPIGDQPISTNWERRPLSSSRRVLFSCSPSSASHLSLNKAIVEQLFARLSDQNLGVIDNLCAEGFSVEIGLLGTDHAAIGI